eukprot:scpid32563/ scgid20129/ Protein SMG9; Protein smg-9 homolog
MMERGLWDSSRDTHRGGRNRRGRGGRDRDGYRGRGRGGYSYYGNQSELWDEKSHRPAEPEHSEPSPPVMPMRIQIKTRSTSPPRPAENDSRAPQRRVPTFMNNHSDSIEKRGGIIARRPILQVDPENQAKSTTTSFHRSAAAKWLYQDGGPSCHKLLDENLVWNDHASDMLQSQSNYLVVGVLGRQSVGKSTIMSLLAGTRPEQVQSHAKPFPVASQACLEIASHQTYGIDMCVTSERVILLDTQPLMSMSILDRMLLQERQHGTSDNAVELYRLQSYQIAAFLVQVCHVVVLVQDFTFDVEMLNLLEMASLLKPSLGGQGDLSGLGHATSDVQPPHLVLVRNKATADDFLQANIKAMHQMTEALMRHSKLRIHDHVSSLRSGQIVCDEKQKNGSAAAVNVFLLPVTASSSGQEGSQIQAKLSLVSSSSPVHGLVYHGHPSFAAASAALVRKIFSIRPHKISPAASALSEIQWFGFAGRIWEAIRKKSLSADLNILLAG